jgi:DNA-binding CsgD family transcriptional regulator
MSTPPNQSIYRFNNKLKIFSDTNMTKSIASIFILIVAIIYFAFDLFEDIFVEDQSSLHTIVESGIFLLIILALWIEVTRVWRLTDKAHVTENRINDLNKKIQEVINEEFERWELTKGEKDIALLLIKGLSMKEIANLRCVKEKTIRQQASGIYAKVGVKNRYELTSHFIEDFFLTKIPVNGLSS